MNEEEKKAVEKFRKLGVKKFREEKIKNEDLLSYIEYVVILNLIEKLQKENEEWQRAYQEEKDRQFDLIKENEKLKAVRKWYFENTVSKICTPEMLNKILRNDYILKQKIKEIVEELEENVNRIKKQYSNGGENCNTVYLENLAQVKILKQILKESEE